MMRTLLAFLLLGLACAAAEPKPLLAVLVGGPDQFINAHDSPTLVLYDDGTLIWLHEAKTGAHPFCQRKVPNAVATVHDLLGFDPAKVADWHSTSEITDQCVTTIWTPARQIMIYGDWQRVIKWRRNDPKASWGKQECEEVQYDAPLFAKMPKEIQQVLERIDTQCRTEGTPWLPAKIAVVFDSFVGDGIPAVPWPKDWPEPHVKETPQDEHHARSYVIRFPPEMLPKLREFMAAKHGKLVIFAGAKKSDWYRFPFPGEGAWMKE